MADVRALLTAMGYTGVCTRLHSGNVVFTTAAQPADVLASAIEDRLAAGLTAGVKVMIRTSRQVADVVADNPLRAGPANPSRFFVAFLSAAADPAAAGGIEAQPLGDERIWVRGAEAFLWCPSGFSLLRLSKMIEQQLQVVATARNWNTVTRLASLTRT